jgi:arylsulfatase A-like enzyme
LTGRYPSQTGITENGYRIPPGERTLAQCLDAAGYDTVYYGKWHLGGPPGGNRWVPPEARGGFREFCGWESHHVDHWSGWTWKDAPEEPIELEGHETDGLTDLAADKLRELSSRERPFAMFISYQAPHPPCSPPRPHLSSYTANPPRLRENAQPHARFVKPEWGCDMTTEEFLPGYFGEISHLDAAFGRLLETLEETGLDRNTIVVFTSDHGEQAGSHGLFGKEVMYEESLRVPLAVRHPGGRAAWGFSNGSKASRLVSSVDLFPTLLDLLGVPVPDSAEGRSLVSSGEERECVFAEYDTSCIRTRHYKLVTDRDVTRTLALYDLAADPFEQVNRGGEGAQIEAELFEELRRWREDVDSRAGEPEIAATPLPGRAQDAKDMERTQ